MELGNVKSQGRGEGTITSDSGLVVLLWKIRQLSNEKCVLETQYISCEVGREEVQETDVWECLWVAQESNKK
jgi:hypothetical protein